MDKYIDYLNGTYPLTLEEIRKGLYNISLPKHPTREQLQRFGFDLVHSTPKPVGFNVVEGKPRLVDGEYYQTWKVADFENLETFKKTLRSKFEGTLKEKRLKGFSFKGHAFKIEGNEEIVYAILDFMLKKDTGSVEPVYLRDMQGSEVKLEPEDITPFVQGYLKFKNDMVTDYENFLLELGKCDSLDECKALKKRLDCGG